jgi:hypothetical protein
MRAIFEFELSCVPLHYFSRNLGDMPQSLGAKCRFQVR